MDYDAVTGEVYTPDEQNQQIDVLTPLAPGTDPAPHEPNRIIHLQGAPQSVAITSDGQLGFVALSGGKVAMIDVPGRQIVNTIDVGGTPHFIITGLYPPLLGTTPQEASTWTNVLRIAGFVLILVFILGSTLLIRRNRRLNSPKKSKGI
jgi:hypothetical protein